MKALKLAMSDIDVQSMFTDLGTNWEVSDALMEQMESYMLQNMVDTSINFGTICSM